MIVDYNKLKLSDKTFATVLCYILKSFALVKRLSRSTENQFDNFMEINFKLIGNNLDFEL